MDAEAPLSVSVRDAAKRFGGTWALRGVSLDIGPGEFVSLLGPSGSGKTTLLNIIAGFTAPDSGAVLLGRRDVTALPPERRGLGMVFQSYSLFPHMTVAENVAFPLRMRGVPRAEAQRRVAAALALVRLDAHAARRPAQLSGGQQQRVAFARAVVARPGVLLMDEPLAALDLKLREALQAEIAFYRAEIGSTFIYVTHDQGEAMALSDRVAVMRDGQIAQVGTPAEIYDRPQTRFVAGFVGQANLLPAHDESGRLRIADCDTGLGPFPPQAAGARLLLCLRPEHLSRTGEGPGLGAIIREARFLGSAWRYEAVTPSGALLHFSEARDATPLATGTAVTLRFNPSHAVPVLDDEAHSHPGSES